MPVLATPVPPLVPGTIPVKVVASAAMVILALPSKATPLMFLDVANLVAVAELPVTLAAIGLVTVKLVSVPTEVKEDPTIVEFKEVPVKVVAAAGTVISALPSKAHPFIFFVAANLVAVAALPVGVI